jgi:CheY-like chemotaxis protein
MRIEVRDTGRGVPPDRLEAIFERFVSDAAGDARSHSTGLGLPISRELARAMGGDVSASSGLAKGSCFALDLPGSAARAESTEERLAEPPPAGRLWVVGASSPLEVLLRFMMRELGVEARFIDRLPSEAEWADGRELAQAFLVDTWVGHGHCIELLPGILDHARQHESRVIVMCSVAQDAAFGVLEDVWQLFRPPSRDSLREALAWAFDSDAPAGPVTSAIASHMRILLADDNAVNQIIGKVMLEEMGADVVVAHGGQAALEESFRRPFDLILMDLQMPQMDGLETTRRLRVHERRENLPRTPVVAVTGQAAIEVETACRDAGMDEVLPKPYTIDQLRAVVESHIRQTTE